MSQVHNDMKKKIPDAHLCFAGDCRCLSVISVQDLQSSRDAVVSNLLYCLGRCRYRNAVGAASRWTVRDSHSLNAEYASHQCIALCLPQQPRQPTRKMCQVQQCQSSVLHDGPISSLAKHRRRGFVAWCQAVAYIPVVSNAK